MYIYNVSTDLIISLLLIQEFYTVTQQLQKNAMEMSAFYSFISHRMDIIFVKDSLCWQSRIARFLLFYKK